MAITIERAPLSPDPVGMGEPEGTDIISANFQGNVQLSKIAYLGGKTTIGQLPIAQYQISGILIDPASGVTSWVNPIPILPAPGANLASESINTGKRGYENAVKTGGAISTRDLGGGYKTLILSNIYTIFGDLVT